MTATVVFVHGSGSGAWAYQDVIAALAERGVASVAVDLPSHALGDPAINFHDDARHVRRVIDDVGGSVVLVGNSYGGMVISEAGDAHPAVTHLVYVAALMLDAGQSFVDGLKGNNPELVARTRFRDDGTVEADVESLLEFAAQQAPEHAKESIRANAKRPMSVGRDPTATTSSAAWTTIPSTYVVCTEDLGMRPDFQREMATGRATEIVENPWDHWPQHSQPQELADLLAQLASDVP